MSTAPPDASPETPPPPAPIDSRPTWARLAESIAAGDRRAVRRFMADLEPLETVRTVTNLDEEDRARLLELLRPGDAADVLEHIPDVQASEALENLTPKRAARILEELPSHSQADLIGDIDQTDAEAILAQMPAEDARELRALAAYPEGTAGSLMSTEYVTAPGGSTVTDVVEHLREHADDYANYVVQYTYVHDARDRLLGTLRLRDLLVARPTDRIERLMIPEPLTVRDDATLEELVHFFDEHRFFGVPVVDAAGHLVGVLARDSVEAAVAEESEETFRATQGIVGGEELRSMPLLLRSRRRLSWLSVNILLNVLAASVIAFYQDTLEAVIALAVFLPIISDMSGCSGSQAVAVSLRELTLGVARPSDARRVILQELRVGVINGICLGALIAFVAWLWKGNAWLGLVVGAALAVNTVVAVCIGGSVPLVLKALRKDPALASGPILTTVTDMCGFFLVLSLASLVLGRLA